MTQATAARLLCPQERESFCQYSPARQDGAVDANHDALDARDQRRDSLEWGMLGLG